MILARYLGQRYLRAFLLMSGVFAAILLLINMVEQVRRLSGHDVSLMAAARLAALSISGSFYAILPLIGLLAAILMFLSLSRASELIAIRASGRSVLKLVLAPSVAALLIGCVTVAVLNPIVAATDTRFSRALTRIETGSDQTVSIAEDGIWLRQGLGAHRQMMIHARRASPDASVLYGVSFTIYGENSGPRERIEAREVRLSPGEWQLTGTKIWRLDSSNPEAQAQRRDTLTLSTDLTADRIREGFGDPQSVSVWKLPDHISGLKRAGFSALRYEVWLQMQLALPLTLAAMVMVASVLTVRHLRGRNGGVLALGAFAAGLAVFFLRSMSQILGDSGDVTPIMAGWAPPVVALLFALGALLQFEDG